MQDFFHQYVVTLPHEKRIPQKNDSFARFILSPKGAPYWRNTKDDGKGWIWLAAEMMLGKLLPFWVTKDWGNWWPWELSVQFLPPTNGWFQCVLLTCVCLVGDFTDATIAFFTIKNTTFWEVVFEDFCPPLKKQIQVSDQTILIPYP